MSHLRVSDRPIRSTYLIGPAGLVACHHTDLLERLDVFDVAEVGATILATHPGRPRTPGTTCPAEVQAEIVDRGLHLWVVRRRPVWPARPVCPAG